MCFIIIPKILYRSFKDFVNSFTIWACFCNSGNMSRFGLLHIIYFMVTKRLAHEPATFVKSRGNPNLSSCL